MTVMHITDDLAFSKQVALDAARASRGTMGVYRDEILVERFMRYSAMRAWWKAGRVVHRIPYDGLTTMMSEAVRCLRGRPTEKDVPSLAAALAAGRPEAAAPLAVPGAAALSVEVTGGWVGCYEFLLPDGVDPSTAVNGLLVRCDGESVFLFAALLSPDGERFWVCLEVNNGLPVIWPRSRMAARLAFMQDFPEYSASRAVDDLSWLVRVAMSVAWATQSPITRLAPVEPPTPPRRRRARRRKRPTVALTQVHLVPRLHHQPPGLTRMLPAAPRPRPPTGTADRRPRWAPAHTGIRWVHEDNVRRDESGVEEEILDLKERNDRLYCAVNRPVRGWGQPPEGARQRQYTVDSRYDHDDTIPRGQQRPEVADTSVRRDDPLWEVL